MSESGRNAGRRAAWGPKADLLPTGGSGWATLSVVTIRNASRSAVRAGAVVALAAGPLIVASPAFAAHPGQAGSDPGPGMSVPTAILVFAGIPIGLFLLITVLVMLPSWAKNRRYRPGLDWWAAPVWFGGPSDTAVVEHATDPVALGRLPLVQSASTAGRGGASARW